MFKILEKSGKFVSPEMWEPCYHLRVFLMGWWQPCCIHELYFRQPIGFY